MRGLDSLGFGGGLSRRRADSLDRTEYVLTQRPLSRILSFTRRSIDDVVNSQIAKNEVLGYFKLSKQIDRVSEVRELERQWNPLR
jgi:hypothetical protein